MTDIFHKPVDPAPGQGAQPTTPTAGSEQAKAELGLHKTTDSINVVDTSGEIESGTLLPGYPKLEEPAAPPPPGLPPPTIADPELSAEIAAQFEGLLEAVPAKEKKILKDFHKVPPQEKADPKWAAVLPVYEGLIGRATVQALPAVLTKNPPKPSANLQKAMNDTSRAKATIPGPIPVGVNNAQQNVQFLTNMAAQMELTAKQVAVETSQLPATSPDRMSMAELQNMLLELTSAIQKLTLALIDGDLNQAKLQAQQIKDKAQERYEKTLEAIEEQKRADKKQAFAKIFVWVTLVLAAAAFLVTGGASTPALTILITSGIALIDMETGASQKLMMKIAEGLNDNEGAAAAVMVAIAVAILALATIALTAMNPASSSKLIIQGKTAIRAAALSAFMMAAFSSGAFTKMVSSMLESIPGVSEEVAQSIALFVTIFALILSMGGAMHALHSAGSSVGAQAALVERMAKGIPELVRFGGSTHKILVGGKMGLEAALGIWTGVLQQNVENLHADVGMKDATITLLKQLNNALQQNIKALMEYSHSTQTLFQTFLRSFSEMVQDLYRA